MILKTHCGKHVICIEIVIILLHWNEAAQTTLRTKVVKNLLKLFDTWVDNKCEQVDIKWSRNIEKVIEVIETHHEPFIYQGRKDKNVKLNEFYSRKFSLYLFSEDHEWIKWADEKSALFMNRASREEK